MIYAYPFTLARRAVVVSMDLTAQNLHLFHTNHWLKDNRNVCHVFLTAPAFEQPAAERLPAQLPREAMESWSVRDVVQFYESKDASGLAVALDRNAVSGSDLLAFGDWQEVAAELRFTAFAAKKAISLRDAFLRM